MKKGECKKDNNFCAHFVGDIFNTDHINNCYKYCCYEETKELIQKDETLRKVDSALKQ